MSGLALLNLRMPVKQPERELSKLEGRI